ncbi:GNAT family N-acetyltransferase [Devosia albogilva]|uniref:GNAT family N-acetyltransferase n=1 Tax=Devosia albogilva TaxID=429726 RepID=A0ABW5QIA0_9HYPH
MNEYAVVDEVPPLEDYLRLRVLTGLSPKSREGAAIGLPNSVLGVTVRNYTGVVGMGRVIGDHGLFFQVTDIAVDPVHQGQGLGKKIVASLMRRLNDMAPDGSYVSLIADGEAHRLYAQFGFVSTAPASIGMACFIRPLQKLQTE